MSLFFVIKFQKLIILVFMVTLVFLVAEGPKYFEQFAKYGKIFESISSYNKLMKNPTK